MIRHFSDWGATPLLSPNDDLLYFYAFASEIWGGTPDGNIYVYDAERLDSVGTIQYEGIIQPGALALTADGLYLMAGPHNEFNSETNVCLIDARQFEVVGVYDFEELPGAITSKQAPQNGVFL